MKSLLFFTVLISLVSSALCQRDPQSYISRIPSLPENACSVTDEEKDGYISDINKLQKEITDDIRKREKDARSNAKDTENQVKQNLAKQYGLSEADMEKMKNRKNMTEAEKKELMQKMMKGSSIPDKKKSMNTVELAKEQKSLTDKINSINSEFSSRLSELDKTDSSAINELNVGCDPLFKELSQINDGEGATDSDELHRKNVLAKIRILEEKYCNKMTPLYYNLLKERLPVLTSMMPDYKRLQEVISEMNKITTGVQKEIAAPGLMELEAIEDYIKLLQQAFKYKHY